MQLSDKKCQPCEGNIPSLTEAEINSFLKQVPSWEIKNSHVFRQFKFKNFIEAMKFVNKIAETAENEGHHPDISIHYNKVEIEIWTHAVNGLSENDFILAAKISEF